MKFAIHFALVALTIAAGMTASGCAAPGARESERKVAWYDRVPGRWRSDADLVILFYNRARDLKPEELAKELDSVKQAFETSKSDIDRMRLALLLSMPNAGFRNDAAAIEVLHPLVQNQQRESANLQPLAVWLYSGLVRPAEVKRIEGQLLQVTEQLNEVQRRAEVLSLQYAEKLKEEQRRSEERFQKQAVKLHDEQLRSEALQQKLDAILEMEKSMIQREQTQQKPK